MQHTIDSSNPDIPHKLASDILLFVSEMRFSWFIVSPVAYRTKNIAAVSLDAYTTKNLCFTAVLICTVHRFAELVRLLYALAEEDNV